MMQMLKTVGWITLLLNLAVLCNYILLKNKPGTYQVQQQSFKKRQSGINTTPFVSVKKIYNSSKSNNYKFKNIAGNVLGFLPLGFLLPFLVFRRFGIPLSILSVIGISSGFEYIQLYTGCGVFDVDDIILNSLGGVIGTFMWGMVRVLQFLIAPKKTMNFAMRSLPCRSKRLFFFYKYLSG